ncbi:MAG: hypothetical protein EA397_00330 [Deltaproteobacteria bacterium]|nr:MAG: hypothetical protein EA397_00330 [Deltaproteobacteria bacterium]
MPTRLFVPYILPAALALSACPGSEAELDLGWDLVECDYVDHSLAWDQEAPSGQIPEDLLALAEGEHHTTGGYTDRDEEIEVQIAVHREGDSVVWKEPGEEGGCPAYLELPVEVLFLTSDGVFSEVQSVNVVVLPDDEDELWVRVSLPPALIEEVYQPDEGTPYGLELTARFDGEAVGGEVDVLVEGEDGDIAWASSERVFVFGDR